MHLCVTEFYSSTRGKSEVEKEILRWALAKKFIMHIIILDNSDYRTIKSVFFYTDEISDRDEMNAMDQILLVNSSK